MQILNICPPHLSHVVTLPWEIQKSFPKANAASRNVSVSNTRAPAVAYPRRSTRAMQIIGSTKQQYINSQSCSTTVAICFCL